jgi:RHS repeat-associated protein
LAERHINREAWPCLSIYGLKSNIPEYIIKNNEKYKIISNHLGSPIEIAEASMGALPVLQMKYDSFGNIIEQNGDFEIPFGFAGGLWDKDTKLTRFGVRDYDSETGRWTSKEPLGFAGTRNFYVYAGNDGVNHVDLDGRNAVIIVKIIYATLSWVFFNGLDHAIEGDFENSHYVRLMSKISNSCTEIEKFTINKIDQTMMDGFAYLKFSYMIFGEDLYDFMNESDNLEREKSIFYQNQSEERLNRTTERLKRRLGL